MHDLTKKPLTEVEAKELCQSLWWFVTSCRNTDYIDGAALELFDTLSRLGLHERTDRLERTLRLATSFHDVVIAYDKELQKAREERDALRVEVSSLNASLRASRSVIGAKYTYCKNCGDEVILDIGQDTGLCRMCWNARGDE